MYRETSPTRNTPNKITPHEKHPPRETSPTKNTIPIVDHQQPQQGAHHPFHHSVQQPLLQWLLPTLQGRHRAWNWGHAIGRGCGRKSKYVADILVHHCIIGCDIALGVANTQRHCGRMDNCRHEYMFHPVVVGGCGGWVWVPSLHMCAHPPQVPLIPFSYLRTQCLCTQHSEGRGA